MVYHSHFLEHLDRDGAGDFLIEVRRVLKLGGIQRIVVPDFEKLCLDYIGHVKICENNSESYKDHDNYIGAIISQCVMKEAFTTSQQPPMRRLLENMILGDARKRGIAHQWMYDRINLELLLTKVGFNKVKLEKYNISFIPDWNKYGLDMDSSGNEYKPESFYIEAFK